MRRSHGNENQMDRRRSVPLIVTNGIAMIIKLPESKQDKRRVFAEWKNGSRDWISRDDLREIWATS